MNELASKDASELSRYSEEQIHIIRNHVATADFSDDELIYCLSVARARGLDPLQKQVYFTKRRKKDFAGNWTATVTVEPTIDGFRAMAERTEELDGYDGPYWCGEDGAWKDAWLSLEPPVAAKITVFRKGKSHGFTSVARYDAYVQSDKDGRPNHMWAKMHDNQLAKCAEALALRKAFPSHLGPFYTREEMGQADAKDNFASLPKESPRVLEQVAPSVVGLPPIPNEITDIPPAILKAIKLSDLEGLPLANMQLEDLERVMSGCEDNKPKARTDLGRKWLSAVAAVAKLHANGLQMDLMPK